MMSALLPLLVAPVSWTLVLAGDVMLNGISPKGDPFAKIAGVVRDADVAIANLEIPLTGARTLTSRKSAEEVKARTQFVLKADPGHIKWLSGAGFDMVSTANNHAMDYGSKGLGESLGLLDSKGILHAGAGRNWSEARRTAVFETASGYRVALVSFLAFVTNEAMRKCTPATAKSAGIAVLPLGGTIDKKTRARLAGAVAEARRSADFVIVALHWGVERQTLPIPYQVNLGRAFVDAGADLVWGHHPHVLQGSEIYRGKPILYSTGNLISARPGRTALYGLSFEDGDLNDIDVTPCSISGGRVVPLEGKDAALEVKRIGELNGALRKRYPSKRSRSW